MLEHLTAAVGPAGDTVCVPMRIVDGSVSGIGADKQVVGGSDFAMMYADEKLPHEGVFVATDPTGDVVCWYDGTSEGREGAYDGLLDGDLNSDMPTRVTVRTASTNPEWRRLNRKPLVGVGSFDGVSGILDVTVLSITENEAQN